MIRAGDWPILPPGIDIGTMTFTLALVALILEALLGYPDPLFQRIGHPVTWIGRLIAWLDAVLNRPERSEGARRALGVLALVVLVGLAGGLGFVVERTLGMVPGGLLLAALLASSLLAQRSLYQHVARVAQALESDGIEAGRLAVAHIVGRDPTRLDEAGVSRAAIESLAENFSDGVVAPALWLAVGGLGGGAAYKAVNTADSMIGHRTPRHAAFGWASARFDDLINLPASRLSGLLLIVAAALVPGASPGRAWGAIRHDAHRHRSPNAGWPEAALAGALGIAIGGPRFYAGVLAEVPYMGEGGRVAIDARDIRAALRLHLVADVLLILLVAGLALVTWRA